MEDMISVHQEPQDVENNQNVVNIHTEPVSIEEHIKDSVKATGAQDIQSEDVSQSLYSFKASSYELESDNETEEISYNKNKVSRKSRLGIIDSDSENEQDDLLSLSKNDIGISQKSSDFYNIESDNLDENEESTTINKKPRRLAIIESDSEDEPSKQQEEETSSAIFVVDNKGELLEENEALCKNQKKIFHNLCDSESSDEASGGEFNDHDEEEIEKISDSEVNDLKSNKIVASGSRKGKIKKTNVEKEEKMTAKKALEQRKEIMAESQRRTRESEIYLPYHKPKSRNLKEFLQNRPKLAVALREIPKNNSPSASVKLSKEQLKVVTHKISERVKEVEEFYKSDSESENENEISEDDISRKIENDIETNEQSIVNSEHIIPEGTKEINDNLENVENSCTIKDVEILEKVSEVDNTAIPENNYEDLNPPEKIIPVLETIPKSRDKMDSELSSNAELTEETQMDTSEENSKIVEEDHEIIQNRGPNIIAMNTTAGDEEQNHQIDENNDDKSQETKKYDFAEKEESKENMELKNKDSDMIDTTEDATIEKKDAENIISEDEIKNAQTENSNLKSFEKKEDKERDVSIEENKIHLDSSRTKDKIEIISDVIIKSSVTEKTEDKYNLDDELMEFAKEAKENSMDGYEFNLDDIEDEDFFEQLNTRDGLVEGNVEVGKTGSVMLKKIDSDRPRLSGGLNDVIDLENDLVLPDKVALLRERYLQHNSKVAKSKKKKSIGKLDKEELLASEEDEDDESLAPIETPGVRLQKLRIQLSNRIYQRRSEIWKEKLTKSVKEDDHKEEEDGEKSDCGIDNILDDEEEEDMTESEEELEENDCDMTEKKKKRSEFIDGEAEESDIEENEIDEEKNEMINEDAGTNEEMCEETEQAEEEKDGDVEDNDDVEEFEDESPRKRVLKRIIKPFGDDDSDDADDDNDQIINQKNKPFELWDNKQLRVQSDDDFIPPHQPTNYKIMEPILTPTRSESEFSTPVTFMTGLKNLNTSGSRVVDLLDESQDQQQQYSSVSMQTQSASAVVNTETPDVTQASQISTQYDSIKPNSLQSDVFCTQDVLDVCSGNFPCSSPEISTQQLKEIFTSDEPANSCGDFSTQDLADICSGKFTGVTQNPTQSEKETALDANDENLISQLIDEDELEMFKKKFESPVAPSTQKIVNMDEAEEVMGTGGVIESDDEDEGLKLKRSKKKRITFSDEDDDSDEEEEEENEETLDLQDNEGVDDLDDVEYDSEENELEENGEELANVDVKKERMKASEFFEKEAELSESEWGSEDEDEKNLDDMEFEKGDEDKFDDDELRTDIEKLQMRQMLDEDNREVKLLQELLLEDGELHGSGRQRQFRWKNIDAAGNEVEENREGEDKALCEDDEESELQFRKMRHEREMFIMKKRSQREENILIDDTKISFKNTNFKIKSQTSILSQTIKLSEENYDDGLEVVSQPFGVLNKKISFLTRSEQILQKFTEAEKVSLNAKNCNRIVFQAADENVKKRKSSSLESESDKSTPLALKKIRLSGLSPALSKRKPKSSKSLFSTKSVD